MLWLGYSFIDSGIRGWFETKVPHGASVLGFMKQIKTENPDLVTCSAANMKLFLVRKRDDLASLSDASEGEVDNLNDGPSIFGVGTVESTPMRRTRDLEAYLPRDRTKNLSANSYKTHFVVRLPNDYGPSNMHYDRSTPNFDVANLTETQIKLLLEKLNFRIEFGEVDSFGYAPEPVDTTITGFVWQPNIDQRQRYMTYLRNNALVDLNTRDKFFLEDASEDDTLMIVKDCQLPLALRGKADLVLVDSVAKQQKDVMAGLRMVIMVRRNIQPLHEAQMIGQLVSTGTKAPSDVAPMALLTDLNNEWHFFWFESNLLRHLLYKWPANAIKFMKWALPLVADCAFQVPEFNDFVEVVSLARVLDPALNGSRGKRLRSCRNVRPYAC